MKSMSVTGAKLRELEQLRSWKTFQVEGELTEIAPTVKLHKLRGVVPGKLAVSWRALQGIPVARPETSPKDFREHYEAIETVQLAKNFYPPISTSWHEACLSLPGGGVEYGIRLYLRESDDHPETTNKCTRLLKFLKV